MNRKHYLITRFNIGIYGRSKVDPEAWMPERIRLFKTYCAPSVRTQTCQDFSWIVLVDRRTPDRDQHDILNAMRPEVDELVYVDVPDRFKFKEDEGEPLWLPTFRLMVLSTQADIIITSRLDNDDAIASDFMQEVKTMAARGCSGAVVDFPYGSVYDESSGKAYAVNHAKGSSFISLVSRVSSKMHTVYRACHRTVAIHATKYMPVPNKSEMWLMVLHGNNMSNRRWFEKNAELSYEVTPSWPATKGNFGL